jgi:kynurenine formamidase
MKLIDLTLPLRDGMPVHPGDPAVSVRLVRDLAEHGFRLHELSLGSHAGTHVNAPWHMADDGCRLEELPLTHLVVRAVVQPPDRSDEQDSDAPRAVPIPPGLGLIYADAPLDARELPRVLAASPPFVAQDARFPLDEDVERTLCRAGIVSFENLVNTGDLPRGREFLFVGLPLSIVGDGAPVRAVAVLIDEDCGGI